MKTDRKAARAAALLKSWPARQLALLLLLLVASHQLGRGAFGATYTIGLVASAPTAADAQAIAGVYLAVEHINSKNDSIVQKVDSPAVISFDLVHCRVGAASEPPVYVAVGARSALTAPSMPGLQLPTMALTTTCCTSGGLNAE